MTNQEAFDKVWDWFVVQGHGPSALMAEGRDVARCFYRATTGERCAAGVLMPDELYEPRFDVEQVPVWRLPKNVIDGIGVESAFLEELQAAHDSSASNAMRGGMGFAQSIRPWLESLARRKALSIPSVAA